MMCPDNYDRWRLRQAEQDRKEAEYNAKRPECEICGRVIEEDELFYVEGYTYHIDCFHREHMISMDDYIYR